MRKDIVETFELHIPITDEILLTCWSVLFWFTNKQNQTSGNSEKKWFR